ncbi:MAG: thioredoxin family protein [Sedimentisphaerales bacterium]|nr:thioredoxin family protein [Sedimentisphaerales bacterium]
MVSMKKKQKQKNKRINFVLLIILFCAGITYAGNTVTDSAMNSSQIGLKWSTSYQEALEQAKLKKLPVLIKFEASWCVWCEKMEDEVFTDPEVIKELDKFVCVKIDVDKQSNIAKAYKIKSLPRTIVINVYDEIVGDWLGFHEATVFSKLLRDIDEYTHTQTGTTSMPELQEAADTSLNSINIPEMDPNNTNDLIGLLGHKNSGVNRRVVELLVESGPKILPIVVPALEGKYLGTRIAAWKVVRELTGKKYKYDPWSSRAERIQAAEKIKKELQ